MNMLKSILSIALWFLPVEIWLGVNWDQNMEQHNEDKNQTKYQWLLSTILNRLGSKVGGFRLKVICKLFHSRPTTEKWNSVYKPDARMNEVLVPAGEADSV